MARLRRASPVAKGAAHGGSTLRFVVTFFALLAFSLQSYVTQTHIHIAPDKTVSYGGKSAQKRLPDRFPANGDPSNCPICQEVLHSGQFLTPSAAALLPPSAVASVVPLLLDVAAVLRAASHAWRSRAPPQA